MTRAPLRLALCIVAAACCTSAHAAHHEGEAAADAPAAAADEKLAWDPARVVELAREVQSAVAALREMERRKPPEHIASGQAAVRMRYMDTLRVSTNEARSLADSVEKGKGRDETLHQFQRLQELLRNVAEEARRMFLPEQTLDKILATKPAIDELRRFYTGKADTRSPLHGPEKDD